MGQFATYPSISTRHFSQTVGFYEDIFGFVPFYETEGYARLRHKDMPSTILVVIDANHEILPAEVRQETKGLILSFVTDKFEETYDALYHEGMTIVQEPKEIPSGFRHFMVADPNNPITINVMACQTAPDCICDYKEHELAL